MAWFQFHKTFLQEWWRLDPGAPWKLPEHRPGPTPFKPGGHPFQIVPGGDSCERVKPDIVHTFHIGFGADMCASMVVWLCKLGKFGTGRPRESLEEKLSHAYSMFREYCHTHKRFTACAHWSLKKFSMSSILRLYWITWVSQLLN